jgi:Zn-dependent protease
MGSSIRLGRIAGIEIGINWSWLVVFGLIAWSLAGAVFPSTNPGLAHGTYIAMAIVAAACFFASLVLHELGHAIVAQRNHIRIDGITLWLFGGVAKLGGTMPSAGSEFRVAIAGPLVSLVVGVALTLIAWLVPLPDAVDAVAAWLGYSNLILLVFNLLPALPLDGGRVLRSALWQLWRDYRRATGAAVRLSRVLALLLILGGLVLLVVQGAYSGLWLAFVGWFLLSAAASEARAARGTPPDVTVATVASRAAQGGYPLVLDDRVVAYAIFQPAAGVPGGPLPQVEPELPLTSAFQSISAAREDRALVVDGGRVVGLLAFERPSPWSALLRMPFRSRRV